MAGKTIPQRKPIIPLREAKDLILSLSEGESIHVYADEVKQIGSRTTIIKSEDASIQLRPSITSAVRRRVHGARRHATINCKTVLIKKERTGIYRVLPRSDESANINDNDSKETTAVTVKDLGNGVKVVAVSKKDPTSVKEQYVFLPRDIKRNYTLLRDFRELVLSGNYIYVDHYIVPAIPELFEVTDDGFHLKPEHKDNYKEVCACVVTYSRSPNVTVTSVAHPVYAKRGSRVPRRKVNGSKKYTTCTRKFGEGAFLDYMGGGGNGGSNDETFGEALRRYMDDNEYTIEKLAAAINVSTRTIDRYLADEGLPDLQKVVAICVAMNLFPPDSEYLVHKAGYCYTPTNKIYFACLTFLAPLGLPECNRTLIRAGYTPLTTSEDDEYEI